MEQVLSYSQEKGFHMVEFPVDWPEGKEFEDWLNTAGFHQFPQWTDGEWSPIGMHFVVQIYARSGERLEMEHGFEYLALINDGSLPIDVLLLDKPSLIAFRVAVAPLVAANSAALYLESLWDACQKAFYAWHGHNPDMPCEECAPHLYREERRREQQAKQKRDNENKSGN